MAKQETNGNKAIPRWQLDLEDDKVILSFWLDQSTSDLQNDQLWKKIRDEICLRHKSRSITIEDLKSRWMDVVDEYMGILYNVNLPKIRKSTATHGNKAWVDMDSRLKALRTLIPPGYVSCPEDEAQHMVSSNSLSPLQFYVLRNRNSTDDCALAASNETLILKLGGKLVMDMDSTGLDTLIIASLDDKINQGAFKLLPGNLYTSNVLQEYVTKHFSCVPFNWSDYVYVFDGSDGED